MPDFTKMLCGRLPQSSCRQRGAGRPRKTERPQQPPGTSEVGERRATDMPLSDPYRAEHHRRVSSRPLPHRACSSPAHGVPPGSRRPAFRVAIALASGPSGTTPRPQPIRLPRVEDRGLPPRKSAGMPTAHPATGPSLGQVVLSVPVIATTPCADFRCALGRFVGCTYRPRLLPGTAGWQDPRPSLPVRRRISPVPCSAVQTFRSPYAGGFLGAALPSSSPRPWPSPNRARLGSLFVPAEAGMIYDAAGFA